MLIEYTLRVRNAANTLDALFITSIQGGTNPYIAGPPEGDGETSDPRTGDTTFASYSIDVVDADIGSMQRLVTSLLEDADGRPQLGHRLAILEFRIDVGATQTMLSGLLIGLRRQANGTWRITVGDPLHQLKLTKLFSPASDELLTDFLDDWPTRGCLLGGPVIGGGALDSPTPRDLGGWKMRVQSLGGGQYGLQPVIVYGPPQWAATDKTRVVDVQDAINAAAARYVSGSANSEASPWDTIADIMLGGYWWAGLVTLIDGVPWKPLPVYDEDLAVAIGGARLVSGSARGNYALKVISDGVRTLTDGALVTVRVISALPTEESPLYVSGHPMDLLAQFLDAADIAYSVSAVSDMKDLIGHDARMAFRITSERQLAELLTHICRRDGVGLRTNDAGEIEPFDARLGRSTADPIDTITDADVVDGSVLGYEYDPGAAVQVLNFQSKLFVPYRSGPSPQIVDNVTVIDRPLSILNSDPGALAGSLDIVIDAMVYAARTVKGTIVEFVKQSVARRIFDRWGRGELAAEMTLLRGGIGDSLQLGDEVMVDVMQLPNHNYLLVDNPAIAARAMQIVRRTIRAIGYDVKLVDAGASRQPPIYVPTIAIAASSDRPRTIAEVTILNAATLNGASYGARLQVAFTDDGSDASDEQFTDLYAWGPGDVPTDPIRLPPAVAATTVQVRARTEVPQGRPTNWCTLEKITLDPVDVPTGVTATPDAGDGSRCLLEWTPGSATDLADIWIRKDGESFAQGARVATLEAGSIQFALSGLEPGEDYIATVQQRDPDTQDVSDAASGDVSFTASASSASLDAPTDPSPFAGAPPQISRVGRSLAPAQSLLGGRYGIAVVAMEFPGEVEIAQAVETAPGAGTYGSYVTVGRVDAVSGNWTTWQSLAPNDGLRRKLKARHVGDGMTPSSYSADVIATPWTYQALAPYPGSALTDTRAIVTALYVSAVDYGANQVTVTWSYDGDLGPGIFVLYRIATAGAVADLSGSPTNVGTTSGASPTSIVDNVPDDIISTAGPKVTYSYQVRAYDGLGALLRATEWMSVTYSHA